MTSLLITLPKDVLFIRVLMLDDVDTCKDLASINHSFSIDRIREQYAVHVFISIRVPICAGAATRTGQPQQSSGEIASTLSPCGSIFFGGAPDGNGRPIH
jgi:hypothetical protein